MLLVQAFPPIDPTVEKENLTFDYGPRLGAGVTITSATLTCTAIIGLDASAASRLLGSSSIVASPSSGAPAGAVIQTVGTMVAGVTYQIQCVAQTSDGQALSVRMNLPCATLPTAS